MCKVAEAFYHEGGTKELAGTALKPEGAGGWLELPLSFRLLPGGIDMYVPGA